MKDQLNNTNKEELKNKSVKEVIDASHDTIKILINTDKDFIMKLFNDLPDLKKERLLEMITQDYSKVKEIKDEIDITTNYTLAHKIVDTIVNKNDIELAKYSLPFKDKKLIEYNKIRRIVLLLAKKNAIKFYVATNPNEKLTIKEKMVIVSIKRENNKLAKMENKMSK